MNTEILPFLAVAEGATASSRIGVALVVLVFAIVLALAVRAGLRHFRGEGSCCGGGSAEPPPPADKAIGPEVARRTLELSGLHCMNCVGRVKKALDAIPGAAADVSLDPQRAVVRLDRPVADDVLRRAVEGQGFHVVAVS